LDLTAEADLIIALEAKPDPITLGLEGKLESMTLSLAAEPDPIMAPDLETQPDLIAVGIAAFSDTIVLGLKKHLKLPLKYPK